MKRLTALLTSLFVAAFMLIPEDADAARRLGGARNQGVQRQVTPPPKAAPAQQQAGQQTAAAPNAAAPAAGSRWLGPLAGLAAGLGLGWLLSQGGFGAFASALIMALLAGLVIFALLRIFARKQAPQAGPMQYAGLGRDSVPPPQAQPQFGSGSVAAPSNIPAGFDVGGFLKQAKLNFMRLQSANDRGDAEALRDFTSDELFQTLSSDLAGRGGKPQQTDISGLDAQLLEVTTEGEHHWASVSFQGLVREDDGQPPEAFHEIWHLRKPVNGDGGWMLAGIQQAS